MSEFINEYLEHRNRNEAHAVFSDINEKLEWIRKDKRPESVFYDLPLSEYELIWLQSAVEWLMRRTEDTST